MVSSHLPSQANYDCVETIRVSAITEDENEISLRDANSSRERPRLEGFDMDQDTASEIEVRGIYQCIKAFANILSYCIAIKGRVLFQR